MAITANKLLGKKEKGGALAVIPKSPLVASPGGELAKIPEKPQEPQEDVVYTIRTKVIEIDKLLKGTFVEKKKRQKDEKTEKENEKRKKTESKLEDDATDSDDEEENKLKMPRLSFLDGIKKFISNVLLGWLTFKLIKHLPTIVKFLKPIAAIAGFFIKWGGKFLDGVVTFIDWGYKALDATKGWIGDKFGEDAANKFESFMGNLTKMFNGIVLLGMGIAKMAMSGRPKGPKGPKSKWRKALEKRWKKSRVGKFFRNNAAARKKLIRKITRPVRRVTRALKPKNIVKNLQKTKLGQKVTKRFAKASQQVDEIIKDPKKALKNLKKTEIGKKVTKTTKTITDAVKDPKKALKNLQKTEIGKKVTNIAKKVDPRKWKMPKLKTPGWMKSAG
ncbi:MAG: hypothetical protein VX720_00790, partial [Pseudomonadota bacterium]|nr:hypothetical protein [Pseudomonadota bacterium]